MKRKLFIFLLSVLAVTIIALGIPKKANAACSVNIPGTVPLNQEVIISVQNIAATCPGNPLCNVQILDSAGNPTSEDPIFVQQNGTSVTYSWIPTYEATYRAEFNSDKGDSCTSGNINVNTAAQVCKISAANFVVNSGGQITVSDVKSGTEYQVTITPPKGTPIYYKNKPTGPSYTINVGGSQISSPGAYKISATNGTDSCGPTTAVATTDAKDPVCFRYLDPKTGLCCFDQNSDRKSCVNSCRTWGDNYVYDSTTQKCQIKPATDDGGGSTYKYEIGKCGDVEGVQSAIGCIPTENLTLTMQFALKFIFGAAGGIIVLMVIRMGYDIITSAGDPNKLTAIRERLISIFSGLVLIVFSFVLLKTIGVDILGLPGFTP